MRSLNQVLLSCLLLAISVLVLWRNRPQRSFIGGALLALSAWIRPSGQFPVSLQVLNQWLHVPAKVRLPDTLALLRG